MAWTIGGRRALTPAVVLGITVLLASLALLPARAATDTSVSVSNSVAGATGTATVRLTIEQQLVATASIAITFPSGSTGYDLSNVTSVTTTGVPGTVALSVNTTTNVITVTRNGDGAAVAAGALVTLAFNNVRNPQVSGAGASSFASNAIAITNPGGTDETSAAVTSPTIAAGALSSLSASLSTSTVSASSVTATASFTTANPWPSDGKLVVVFPSGFNVASAGVGTVTGADGSFTASVSGQTVTITRSGGSQTAAGTAVTVPITGVTNPSSLGTTGTFAISTTTSADATIDAGTAAGVEIPGPVSSVTAAASPATAGQTAAYTVSFTLGSSLSLTSPNTITLTFPSDTAVPSTIDSANVAINGVAPAAVSTNTSQRTVTLTVPSELGTLAGGSTVQIAIAAAAGIVNPTTGGTAYQLQIQTSVVSVDVSSAAYTIAGPVSSITVTPDSTVAGNTTGYAVRFTVGTAGTLVAGDTVTLTFPTGAAVPASIATGNVTVNGVALGAAPAVSGRSVTLSVPSGVTIPAGSVAVVSFASGAGLVNPAVAATHQLSVRTSRAATDVSESYTIAAGAATALQVLLPGETAAPGTATGKTGTPAAQTAATAFNATVNAVDQNWNVVAGSTPTVAITSSDTNAVLPSSAALASGTGSFSVTLRTAGTRTITATDTSGTLAAGTSGSVTVNPGAAIQLQVVLAGESAAPGTTTGKTGTATAQSVPKDGSVSVAVTINAVDAAFNVVTTAAPAVTVTAGSASPTSVTLAAGTGTAQLTFTAANTYTITAEATGLTSGSASLGITEAQPAADTGGGVTPVPIVSVTVTPAVTAAPEVSGPSEPSEAPAPTPTPTPPPSREGAKVVTVKAGQTGDIVTDVGGARIIQRAEELRAKVGDQPVEHRPLAASDPAFAGSGEFAPHPALTARFAVQQLFRDQKLGELIPLVARRDVVVPTQQLSLTEAQLRSVYLYEFKVASAGRWVPVLTTFDPVKGELRGQAEQSMVAAMTIDPQQLLSAEQDYPLPAEMGIGRFFSQANGAARGQLPLGYSIADTPAAAPFFGEFERIGGVPALGYPASRVTRFGSREMGVFDVQLTQKAVLQWLPGENRVAVMNIMDILHDLGFDRYLRDVRQIPEPFDSDADIGLTWGEILDRRLAWLDSNDAIKEVYFSDPEWLEHYGLPVSFADMGSVFVIRTQRAAFQYWKVPVPWARAGEVTIVNSGDIFKELALQAATDPAKRPLLPLEALTPELPPGIAVAPEVASGTQERRGT